MELVDVKSFKSSKLAKEQLIEVFCLSMPTCEIDEFKESTTMKGMAFHCLRRVDQAGMKCLVGGTITKPNKTEKYIELMGMAVHPQWAGRDFEAFII